jgi:hypothetical protein
MTEQERTNFRKALERFENALEMYYEGKLDHSELCYKVIYMSKEIQDALALAAGIKEEGASE